MALYDASNSHYEGRTCPLAQLGQDKDERLSAEDTVRSYKMLAQVEQGFRCMKGIDLRVRPIYHRDGDRVRAHFFLCMLAYYVEWHMRRVLAPLLFQVQRRVVQRRIQRPRQPRSPHAPQQFPDRRGRYPDRHTHVPVAQAVSVPKLQNLLDPSHRKPLPCQIASSRLLPGEGRSTSGLVAPSAYSPNKPRVSPPQKTLIGIDRNP